MDKTAAKTLTLRLPLTLHQAVSAAAAERRVSLNALLQTAIETYLDQLEEQRLFDSYTRLGEDTAECDVEYAWDAQREAIDRASA